MFLPLHDGVALRHIRRASGTITLISINVLVYLISVTGLLGSVKKIELGYGLIPAVLMGSATLSPDIATVHYAWTPFTSMFLHGGLMHLAGNMLFLWVFGDNVEDAMGTIRFILFYFACGLCAALAYVLIFPEFRGPLIGASGAISGVAAAYLILHPRVPVFGLVFSWFPAVLPSGIIIGLWIAYQIVFAVMGGSSGIAWWAHVGGIAAGAILLPLLRRRRVALK